MVFDTIINIYTIMTRNVSSYKLIQLTEDMEIDLINLDS